MKYLEKKTISERMTELSKEQGASLLAESEMFGAQHYQLKNLKTNIVEGFVFGSYADALANLKEQSEPHNFIIVGSKDD